MRRSFLEFDAHGLEWRVSIPATNLVVDTQTGSEIKRLIPPFDQIGMRACGAGHERIEAIPLPRCKLSIPWGLERGEPTRASRVEDYKIDLGDIRQQVRRNRYAVPQRHGIALLHRELCAMFDPTNRVQIHSEPKSLPCRSTTTCFMGRGTSRDFWKSRSISAKGSAPRRNLPVFQMPGATTRCARCPR